MTCALAFEQLGVPLFTADIVPVVRRMDLAADVHFEDGQDGLDLLRLCAALDTPHFKVNVYAHRGRVETVSYITPRERNRVLRVYDKGQERRERGVETPLGAPGRWVRIERQLRFAKRQQQSPAAIATADLGSLWLRPLAGLAGSTGPLRVHASREAQRLVLDAVSAGEVSALAAERLVGALAIREAAGADWYDRHGHRHAGRRRVEDLRQLGVLPVLEGTTTAPFDVAELFAEVQDRWAAQRQ
jgi:hypothetical protein